MKHKTVPNQDLTLVLLLLTTFLSLCMMFVSCEDRSEDRTKELKLIHLKQGYVEKDIPEHFSTFYEKEWVRP